MTDTAAISGHIHFTGRSLGTVPFGRPAARETEGTVPSRGAGGSIATSSPNPISAPPLLNGGTQIAAQQAAGGTQQNGAEHGDATGSTPDKPAGTDPSNPENLSEEEQQKVQELQQRDREVRAHEQAHKAAGGALTGSPSFKTVRGPDGRSYAVSGEVKIDTSPVPKNPEATIRKLEQVKRAALAPSNPSAQDRRVAAEAEAKIQQARQEKREKDAEELEEANGKAGAPSPGDDPLSPATAANPLKPGQQGQPGGHGTPNTVRPADASRTLNPGSLFNLVA